MRTKALCQDLLPSSSLVPPSNKADIHFKRWIPLFLRRCEWWGRPSLSISWKLHGKSWTNIGPSYVTNIFPSDIWHPFFHWRNNTPYYVNQTTLCVCQGLSVFLCFCMWIYPYFCISLCFCISVALSLFLWLFLCLLLYHNFCGCLCDCHFIIPMSLPVCVTVKKSVSLWLFLCLSVVVLVALYTLLTVLVSFVISVWLDLCLWICLSISLTRGLGVRGILCVCVFATLCLWRSFSLSLSLSLSLSVSQSIFCIKTLIERQRTPEL